MKKYTPLDPIDFSLILEILERKHPERSSADFKAVNEKQKDTFRENLANPTAQQNQSDALFQDPSSALFDDLQTILEKGDFTDVTLTCSSETIRAHKMMLCARSPVFAAMFSSAMQESEKNNVIIDDIKLEVLQDLLLFIYSGRIKNLTQHKACDLLYAAEKYQISCLKQACVQYLKSITTGKNAIQILQSADLYDEQLKTDTIGFIKEHFSAVKTTEEWKNLQSENPALAVEVYAAVVEKLP